MGVSSYNHEVATSKPIAPSRMFKALFVDSHNLLPKVMPQAIKSLDILHGDGGVGSIKQMNYFDGDKVKYVKHKIEVVDNEKLVCKYVMIEGDVMGDKIESIESEAKFESNGNGGCIGKTTNKYNSKGVSDDGLKVEELDKEGNARAEAIFKAVEEYLAANPSVYA